MQDNNGTILRESREYERRQAVRSDHLSWRREYYGARVEQDQVDVRWLTQVDRAHRRRVEREPFDFWSLVPEEVRRAA